MKKRLFKIFKIIISILLLVSFATIWYRKDSYDAFEIVATFLSIVIGFTITGLSIIATSKFSKNLYHIEQDGNNSKTLLHVLIGKFSTGTYVFISTILLIIIHRYFQLGDVNIIYKVSLTYDQVINSIICYLTLLSIYHFTRLFKVFCQFITQESRE